VFDYYLLAWQQVPLIDSPELSSSQQARTLDAPRVGGTVSGYLPLPAYATPFFTWCWREKQSCEIDQ
jgi:hypothetical protein